MTENMEGKAILTDETERKPNLYAANVLAWVVMVITVVFLLNEMGIFEVNRSLVHICLTMSLVQLIVMRILSANEASLTHPASKYVIMSMVLLLVLTMAVLLNIHTVLGFVLPILLATQYRSRKISAMALIGSVICCGVSPILSYLLKTWSEVFLTGFIETFCRVKISVAPVGGESVWVALSRITLYWSLPQMLTLSAFGAFLYSATINGITGVENQLKVVALKNDLSAQLESISSMQERLLYTMSDIIENRDLETGGHVRRTSEVVRLIADAIRMDPDFEITDTFYRNVINSAPLHDLGKIAIPDSILKKPGALTDEEYEKVKEHPIISAQIIEKAMRGVEDEELIETAKNIALYHHERMDGKGYPEGLKGEQIPLEARIMAIADVYDALVSERCYKASMDFGEAYDTIQKAMGTQFDPGLNKYFILCLEKIQAFYEPEKKE
ncbi:MAG: HD-GYP domain-containing protein [Eubacteriaceae bacterium]|nr:HD-GYP domain-containing protein [Eubacteriaceae bacterium]